ncbi:glycosyltransferase [Haloarcula litorea]|uniref:glycosyltransferase n=1 Tax=Haloarcula litorea TaxID=3032579 RepID=UPI0023E8BFEE|nr:glycosyltransferase [Halomicroarcula sp. GDY20]
MTKRVLGPNAVGYTVALFLLTARAPFYDIVFIQKVPLPGFYVRFLRLFTPVVYDFDDALFVTKPSEGGRSKWKPLLDSCLSASTAVVAGSAELRTYAEQYADDVFTLPTGIPRDPHVSRQQRAADGEATIGWIGNPENLIYLEAHSESLERVLQDSENTKLLIITAGSFPTKPLADRDDVEYREWSVDTGLDALSEADIGIRPLSEDRWTRSKGGFTSVIQMMALALPVVVTPVGMLSEIVEHKKSGFHAENSTDWETYLNKLVSDETLRQTMGDEAAARVDERGFWAEDKARELAVILRDIRTQRSAPN